MGETTLEYGVNPRIHAVSSIFLAESIFGKTLQVSPQRPGGRATVPPTASLVASLLGLRVMGHPMGLISAGHSIGVAMGAYFSS